MIKLRHTMRTTAALCLITLVTHTHTHAQTDADARRTLDVQRLGEPVRTMRLTGGAGEFLIPKPNDAGWWLLLSYHPVKRDPLPNQVFIIDLNSGEVTERSFPDAPGAFTRGAHVAGQDGNHYIGHYATPGIWRFNPTTADLQFLPFQDLAHLRILPYKMGIAPSDGRIYLGTASSSARIIEFDPTTEAFRDLGVIGPDKPSPRYIYTMAVTNDYIYAAAGKNPWYLVAVDRTTGEQTVLLEDPDYVDVGGSSADSATARVTETTADGQEVKVHYHLQAGQATRLDGPPVVSDEQRAAIHAERARRERMRPQLSLDGARPNSHGEGVVAWRMPGEEDWRQVQLTGIQTTGWSIRRIAAMADGRLLGVPEGYEDIFIYDPAAQTTEILGKSPLSSYSILPVGERVFILGYPGSYIVEYDPAQPWTYATAVPGQPAPPLSSPQSNPREAFRYGGLLETHHIINSALGADGAVYFGAHAERLHVGGALGWWDPAKREPGGLRQPFAVEDCAGFTAAQDGRTMVYASKPVTDPRGQTPTPEGASLFVFDVATRTLTGQIQPQANLESCGPIIGIGDHVHGFANTGDGLLYYRVDLRSGQVTHREPIRGALGSNLLAGPDGQVYFILDQTLMRLDPAAASITPVGEVGARGSIAFVGDDLYLAAGSALLRIADVAGRSR